MFRAKSRGYYSLISYRWNLFQVELHNDPIISRKAVAKGFYPPRFCFFTETGVELQEKLELNFDEKLKADQIAVVSESTGKILPRKRSPQCPALVKSRSFWIPADLLLWLQTPRCGRCSRAKLSNGPRVWWTLMMPQPFLLLVWSMRWRIRPRPNLLTISAMSSVIIHYSFWFLINFFIFHILSLRLQNQRDMYVDISMIWYEHFTFQILQSLCNCDYENQV